jgi:hypothetical protein
LLRPDRLAVEGLYAAQFAGARAADPRAGVEASHAELERLLGLLGRPSAGLLHRGGARCMTGADDVVPSAALDDLVDRARTASPAEPLWVVALGAATDVASALVAAPDIRDRVVVVWLGGNPWHWPQAAEYNVQGDRAAARVVLEARASLVHVPCRGVTELLAVTDAELDRHVRGRSALGDYLADTVTEATAGVPGRSKELWDLGAVAHLLDPACTRSLVRPSPVLPDGDGPWGHDPSRPPIRELRHVDRDRVLGDLYARLAARSWEA